MSLLADPNYAAVVNYFINGGVIYQNPNQTAWDKLCVDLTTYTSENLPSTETELISLNGMFTSYANQAQSLFGETENFYTFLQSTQPTLTLDAIQKACIEVILEDFTPSYLQVWDAEISTNLSLIRPDIASFVAVQTANLTSYRSQQSAALQALQAMGNSNNPTYTRNAPVNLQQLLSLVQGLAISFGTIGLSPGQEFLQSGGSTPTVPPSGA